MTSLDLNFDIQTKDGQTVKLADYAQGKKICLYFSAHWCPPCRGFTPALTKCYKKGHTQVEVVFISSDQNEQAFNSYFGEQPWTCLAFAEREKKKQLSEQFDVRGIPTLILFDESGAKVNAGARASVASNSNSSLDEIFGSSN